MSYHNENKQKPTQTNNTKGAHKRTQQNSTRRELEELGIEVPDGYEIDHIAPINQGGTNDHDNIRFLPLGYNRKLGQKITTRKRKKNGTY